MSGPPVCDSIESQRTMSFTLPSRMSDRSSPYVRLLRTTGRPSGVQRCSEPSSKRPSGFTYELALLQSIQSWSRFSCRRAGGARTGA